MSKQVWCWRFIIREPLYDNYDDGNDWTGVSDFIPIDIYQPSFVDDMNAYYNWLYGDNRWWVADTDLIEMNKEDVCIPRWIGFVKLYGDGSHIDYWDWHRNEIFYSN